MSSGLQMACTVPCPRSFRVWEVATATAMILMMTVVMTMMMTIMVKILRTIFATYSRMWARSPGKYRRNDGSRPETETSDL
jgi:hypothetical protein